MGRSQKRIIGKVKKFTARGRQLGFPTANLALHRRIEFGVYLGLCKIKKQEYPGLIFIGKPLTFNDSRPRVEVFIDNYHANLYGHWLSIELIKCIRKNKKFKTAQKLIIQLKKDLYVLRHSPIAAAHNPA